MKTIIPLLLFELLFATHIKEWENKVIKPKVLRDEYIPKLRYTLDSVISNIMQAVATSDLNIAMVSNLSHAEFLVLNPIQCPITQRPHAKSAKMMESFGTWAMAHIVFAGMATFDYDLLRTVKTASKARGTILKGEKEPSEDDKDGSNSDDDSIDVGTFASKLNTLENELSLPSIDDIHSLLRSAFLRIDNKDLGLLQSILRDLLVLQPWTRSLDAKEEKTLSRMEAIANRSKTNVVDLTADTKENSDDDLSSFQKVNFSAITTTAAGTKKQAVQQSTTPASQVPASKITKSSNGSSSKKGFDIDAQITSFHRQETSKQKISPFAFGNALQTSFGKNDDMDTDSDGDNRLQFAGSEKAAKRALANSEQDYEDYDVEGFEGRSFTNNNIITYAFY